MAAAMSGAAAQNPSGNDLWTKDTDLVLRDLVLRGGDVAWGNVASAIEWDTGTVTAQECKRRWDEIKDTPVKGPWSGEEDDHLKRLVEEYGAKKWNLLARAFPGRSGKQCRERWHNHVDERVKKGEWTAEEDQILCEAQRQLGNKWSEMSRILTGRSENAIKNRFNSLNAKGLTEKYANDLIVKLGPKVAKEYSLRGPYENEAPPEGVEDGDDPGGTLDNAAPLETAGVSRRKAFDGNSAPPVRTAESTGGGRGGASIGPGGGRGGASIGPGGGALGRMNALMVAVGEERAACVGSSEDSEDDSWRRRARLPLKPPGSARLRGRGVGASRGEEKEKKAFKRGKGSGGVVEASIGPGRAVGYRKSDMAKAEAGMSVLAQAAGLLDIEDEAEDETSRSSFSESSSSVGFSSRRGSSKQDTHQSFADGRASAVGRQYQLGGIDHGSTPPGSASPLPCGPASGGAIAGDAPCRGGAAAGGLTSGEVTASAFPLGDNAGSTNNAMAYQGGGGITCYGRGRGGGASLVSGAPGSPRSGWYVGPGGMHRRSLESVPGPWRPYWRGDHVRNADGGGPPAEPASKRFKHKELRV